MTSLNWSGCEGHWCSLNGHFQCERGDEMDAYSGFGVDFDLIADGVN